MLELDFSQAAKDWSTKASNRNKKNTMFLSIG